MYKVASKVDIKAFLPPKKTTQQQKSRKYGYFIHIIT